MAFAVPLGLIQAGSRLSAALGAKSTPNTVDARSVIWLADVEVTGVNRFADEADRTVSQTDVNTRGVAAACWYGNVDRVGIDVGIVGAAGRVWCEHRIECDSFRLPIGPQRTESPFDSLPSIEVSTVCGGQAQSRCVDHPANSGSSTVTNKNLIRSHRCDTKVSFQPFAEGYRVAGTVGDFRHADADLA